MLLCKINWLHCTTCLCLIFCHTFIPRTTIGIWNNNIQHTIIGFSISLIQFPDLFYFIFTQRHTKIMWQGRKTEGCYLLPFTCTRTSVRMVVLKVIVAPVSFEKGILVVLMTHLFTTPAFSLYPYDWVTFKWLYYFVWYKPDRIILTYVNISNFKQEGFILVLRYT